MLGDNPNSALHAAALAFKLTVWTLVALSALVLLMFLFKLAPLMLAPLYASRALQTPRSVIDGRFTPDEVRRRMAALRDLTASPQAVANSAKRLTIVGLQFERLREERLRPAGERQGDPLSIPYPLQLDLSATDGDALVALSEQAIEWSVIPPPRTAPRAIFGIESDVFPEFVDPPAGVLAGFRTSDSRGRPVAQPLQPVKDEDENIRRFCKSVADWARYFSLPKTQVDYVLFEDPTQIAFRNGAWTANGVTRFALDNRTLRRVCGDFSGGEWR
jgi:hypothetical protein